MNKSRFAAQLFTGLLLAAATLSLSSCANIIYHEPEYNYAGRPVPPSGLLQRVMVTFTVNGAQGGAQMLDGLRNIRSNVQDSIKYYPIGGYSGADPIQILNFPEQVRGYILNEADGTLGAIDYSKETSIGPAATFGGGTPSVAMSPDATRIVGAALGGILQVNDANGSYSLNLPNVDKVVVNQGNSVVLAMVRNSNVLYRVIHLPQSTNSTPAPGSIDCQPLINPRYCVVPVGHNTGATSFDHPIDAYFSLDGTSVYVVNCGPECGGATAGITVLQEGPLQIDQIPVTDPSLQPAPLATLPVPNPVAVPGGVTEVLSDGVTLYAAGQSLQTSSRFSGSLFGGNLTLIPLSTWVPGTPIPISDGTHTRILFADDNTLWIGSSQCASGVRAATAAYELAHGNVTDQAGNYNCLTGVQLGGSTPVATVLPKVVQSSGSAQTTTVPYPNADGNQFYYGNLTGLCWVQTWHKVFTAYGGQIHIFYTGTPTDTDDPMTNLSPTTVFGTEGNNFYATVQGTVLDVAYMDALTNNAN